MRREPTFDDWNDGEAAPVALRPSTTRRRFRNGGLVIRLPLAAAAIAGITLYTMEKVGPSIASQSETEASRSLAEAQAALLKRPLVALDDPANPARLEAPRWNPASGLREDAMTQGSFDAIEAPFLRILVAEGESSAPRTPSLFVTLARRAAELEGLAVTRTGLRGQVATKLGLFETVEATLAGQGNRLCTGFQSLDPRLHIDGWLCGILGKAPTPRSVSCAIDRIRLARRAEPATEAIFAEAAQRSLEGCEAEEPAPRHSDATGSIAAPKPQPAGRTGKK